MSDTRRDPARRALAELSARLVIRSSLIWGAALGLMSFAVAAGYEGAYPAGSDRSAVVDLGGNPGFRALIGAGHALDTAGGFTAWRFGGPAAVIAAVWGYLTTTRLLRGEEEVGRTELVRAGAVTNSQITLGAVRAAALGSGILVVGALAGMLLAGLAPRGSVLTALAVASGAWVFGAAGVVAAQLLPTRRAAALSAGGLVVAAYLVRAVADTRAGAQWMRWATPFGWSERVNAFADAQPLVLVAPAVAAVALAAVGVTLAGRRDLGASLIADDVARPPRPFGLGSVLGLATRLAVPRLLAWLVPVVAISLTMGSLSKDVGDFFASSPTFQDLMRNFGVDPATPVRAFLGFELTALVVVIACFAVSEMAAARDDEATVRLDNLLVLAVDRRRWLAGRVAVAALGVVVLSVALGTATWVGSAYAGAGIGFGDLFGGGMNLVPVAMLFLGLGALTFAVLPRATAAVGYGVVATAFLWQLVGSAIKAPAWVLDVSPFAHVAPVPSVGVDRVSTVVLLLLGLAACGLAFARFARRDITGA